HPQGWRPLSSRPSFVAAGPAPSARMAPSFVAAGLALSAGAALSFVTGAAFYASRRLLSSTHWQRISSRSSDLPGCPPPLRQRTVWAMLVARSFGAIRKLGRATCVSVNRNSGYERDVQAQPISMLRITQADMICDRAELVQPRIQDPLLARLLRD